MKKLLNFENCYSFVSMYLLNSLLFGCEGLDVNYEVEDEFLFDIVNDEDEIVLFLDVL